MSLFLDIGQGAGTAGATGVRPFLPPLLVGALASADAGVNFDGTDYSFLEKPAFLGAVLALAVVSYMVERSRPNERAWTVALGMIAAGLGAVLFAGCLAQDGYTSWPGLVGGAACAALGYMAVAPVLAGARKRLEDSGALLPLYADAVSLLLAAVAVFAPPVSFVALIALVWLAIAGRRAGDRKFEGLRILR
jgi:hypothetical protein